MKIDERGRVVVTDADAAARQWTGQVHTPRLDEMIRRESAAKLAVAAPAPAGTNVVIIDRDDYDWTAQGLLDALDAHELLCRALVKAMLAGEASSAALVERLAAKLHEEAPLHRGYDDETAAYAARVLWMLVDQIEHPEEYVDDTPNPDKP
ncbi:MAG TPA: hypothetical protein VK601_27925 [Kofleriaceae bacterium]|nr:hypothetical protein [Kofleriaceae bacterium]